jgi:superfamily II DNA or RNA helicase
MITLKKNLDEIKEQLYNIKNIHDSVKDINKLKNLVKKLEINIPESHFNNYGISEKIDDNENSTLIGMYSKNINCTDYLGCYFCDTYMIDIILYLIERILNILKLELSYEETVENIKFNNLNKKKEHIYKINKILLQYINDNKLLDNIDINNTDNDDDILNNPNVYLRKNQSDAINKMIEQDFKTGIHSQIMGAGKSNIILNTIHEHYKRKKKNDIYIISTERIEILRKWFFIPVKNKDESIKDNMKNKDGSIKENIKNKDGSIKEYIINEESFAFWKEKDIINMNLFHFVERFNDKSEIKFEFNKPTIFVCNNAFLKSQSRYTKIDPTKIALILVDECHSINNGNHTMLKYFKNKKISIIAFSATPVKASKTLQKNLCEIYSNGDNKINLISNYSLIDALRDDIVLPFKHIILKPEYTDKNKTELSEKFLKHIVDKYIKKNNDLPYKKGIGWVKRIDCIKNSGAIYNNIARAFNCDILDNYKVLRSYSGEKSVNEIDTFYEENNKSILLCVNRCKEGSDVRYLDYGALLDSVKKRELSVWLQMAGRVMRPDEKKLKQFATILECLDLEDDVGKIELVTVEKIMSYYNMILNLSSYEIIDEEHNKLMEILKNLHNNTYINKETKSIEIDLLGTKQKKCFINFDEIEINWDKFKELLKTEVNKKIGITKEDEFNDTINIIKTLDEFKTDINFWDEYEKLDYKTLNILSIDELKNNYKEIWDNKTWYDVLGTNKYIMFDDFVKYINNMNIKNMNEKKYRSIYNKNKSLPRFPDEYYKFKGWVSYSDLLQTYDIFV